MTDPVQIIANPNSAGGKGARMLPRLRAALEAEAIPYELHTTRAPGHAAEVAAGLAEGGAVRLLAVGGDGTIHEVANGLLTLRNAEPPELAILPVGTGNDFHRMLRAPGGLEALVQVLARGEVREFEVGRVRWSEGEACFVNLLGVGIDVAVLERRAAFARLPGLLQYLGALASVLGRFSPLPLRVEVEGADGVVRTHEADSLLAAVTVGPSVGGGFILSPGAEPDDGLLDLFHAERLGVLEVFRYLPGVLRGTLEENPRIHRGKLTRARIETRDGSSIKFELDGEVMPGSSPFLVIEVNPRRLRILDCPEGGG